MLIRKKLYGNNLKKNVTKKLLIRRNDQIQLTRNALQ